MNKKVIVPVGIGLIVVLCVVAVILAAPRNANLLPGKSYPFPVEATVVVEKAAVQTDAYNTAVGREAYNLQAPVERMIIWNATLSLTVEDTQKALDQVQAVARDLGGYTINTESWLEGEQLRARLTLRIPAEKFDQAMAQLRDLALKVNHENATSQDVTEEYVDLESRLRHLEAKEAQLNKFLEQAENTEAVLAVYEHLAATQAEIEQVKGRMSYLEKLTAMATITVELYPKEIEPPIVEEGWKPGRVVRDAVRALVNTLQGLGNALIWFILYLLPVLLLIALPIAVVVWVIRRRRRRRREKGADRSG